MYKKNKKNPVNEPFQEENSHEHTTLVLTDPHATTFPRFEEIFSSSPVSSATQDPLESLKTRDITHTTIDPSIFARYIEIRKKTKH